MLYVFWIFCQLQMLLGNIVQVSEMDPKMTSYVFIGNKGIVSYTLPGGRIIVFELSYIPMSCR